MIELSEEQIKVVAEKATSHLDALMDDYVKHAVESTLKSYAFQNRLYAEVQKAVNARLDEAVSRVLGELEDIESQVRASLAKKIENRLTRELTALRKAGGLEVTHLPDA